VCLLDLPSFLSFFLSFFETWRSLRLLLLLLLRGAQFFFFSVTQQQRGSLFILCTVALL